MISKHLFALALVGLFASACGSDPPPANDYGAIADGISHPTGMLDKGNARDVADEFGKIRGLGALGTRPQASGTSTSIACGAGGSYRIDVSGASQSGGQAVLDYDACCYVASCCFDGHGDWYYATASGSQFSYCGSYDLTLSCYDTVEKLAYSGCFDTSGGATYLVTVSGKSFAVSGSYSSGSGTVQIAAANGSWSCTFTSTSGTCSGTSTFSI